MFDAIPNGARLIGKTVPLAAAAASTPVLVIGPGWEKLFIYTFIASYTGGGGVARILLGAATTVDTGANYSFASFRVTTTAATVGIVSSVSQNGIDVAASTGTTTNGRRGLHEVWNPIGDPKFVDSRVNTFASATPAAATAAHAAMDFVFGNWWNNSEAQCVAMDGGGAVNLGIGSYISVSGIPRIP